MDIFFKVWNLHFWSLGWGNSEILPCKQSPSVILERLKEILVMGW